MHTLMGFKALALAQVLLLASSISVAAPSLSELDAQAREALRTGQYQQTLAVTREITQVDPSSALNWYRMAIAAEKQRNFTLAAKALQAAEKLDPSLAFASSAERVQTLRALIEAGVSSQAQAGVAADATAASPLAREPAAAAPRTTPADPAGVSQREPAPGSAPGSAGAQGRDASVDGLQAWYFQFTSVGLMLLASLAVLVRALMHATRRFIHARNVDVATMPLDDLIAHCRDNLALLQQRLDYHGHKDTELAALLTRLQPAFARECGRSRLLLERLKTDQPLADVKQELATRIPVLGASSAEQVHKDAVQLALQKQRRA